MNYDDKLAFAKDVAIEAGEIMLRHFRTDAARATWKQENDAVTIADTTINALVIERVKATWPDDGVAGEEESYKPESASLWMVDPVDGTLPYAMGLPIAAFLFSYMVDGRPKVAVAYNPWMNLMYTALEGEGAFCNEQKLGPLTESHTKVVEMLVWKGSIYKLPGIRERADEAGMVPLGIAGGISRFGISEGRLYGAIYADDHPWDIAALDLLVSEVGGVTTDLRGNPIDYRQPMHGAIVGSKKAHAQLLNLVSRQ